MRCGHCGREIFHDKKYCQWRDGTRIHFNCYAVDPRDYTITIRRIDDPLFKATVRELPDVAEFSDEPTHAYDLIVGTIADLMVRAVRENRRFPGPSEEFP